MSGLARRFLLVPGIRSSNIYVFDTAGDPRQPTLHKTITAAELAEKAGYSRPHTLHCGPDGVFLTCLGAARGRRRTRGHRAARPQHLRRDRALGDGPRAAVPRLRRLVAPAAEHPDQQRVGHPLDDRERHRPGVAAGSEVRPLHPLLGPRAGEHTQEVDLGAEHQMALEVRPSHDPEATWGFVGVVISTEDLSGSVFRWHRDGTMAGAADKVITIPAEPADPTTCCRRRSSRSARCRRSSPTSTCRVDDRFLYVSCWGTGELKQYDVSDPSNPRAGRLGAPRRHRRAATPHPSAPDVPLRRRTADGRGQPRRAAGVLHQLALRRLGRPVLPRRRRCLDGQARRRPRAAG